MLPPQSLKLAPDGANADRPAEALGSLGRYRLLSRLAVGGMAEIFLARVDGIGGFEKVVVVKRLIPQYADDPILVRMFMDEARLLAKLDHPHITQVHDVGTQDGHYFFAMEYVHGEDLRSITRACALANTSLSDVLAATIVATAARALHYVHEKCSDDGRPLNIVHRDVSPSNVLVGFNGTVKLADFGVAKWEEQQTSTTHGTLKGKLAYMSPEQAKGGAIDRRSDVFSLGVLMFELFTGTRLFQGATELAILDQITSGQIPSPSRRRHDLPPLLEAAIVRALAVDPDQRFATAHDLAIAVDAFIATRRDEPHDANALAQLMRTLFSRKLATWREAEQGGLTLGEHLARLPAAEVLLAHEAHSDASASADHTQPELVAPEPRAARKPALRWRLWGLGAGLCILAGLWWIRPKPAPVLPPVSEPRAPAAMTTLPAPPTATAPVPAAPPSTGPGPTPRPAPAPKIRRRSHTNLAPVPDPPPVPPTPPSPPAEKQNKVRVWDPDSVLLPK
ncbi:MAG: serine/threonine-protein kinase [Deltaproteobacteria bacterium]|nr:serine/threonine-protein kinase [Deltaproteobacteria bacterium]